MGNTKWFNSNRKESDYKEVKTTIPTDIKVVRPANKGATSTPLYSNTALSYATYDSETKKIKQITCYDEVTHIKIYDIDWGHNHGRFKKGEPHLQYYKDGVRQKEAYELNAEQYALYLKYKDIKVVEEDNKKV